MPTTIAAAEQLLEAGCIEDALEAYRGILADDPGSVRALTRIGGCLIGLGRFSEAAESLAVAASAAPDQPLIQYRLAVARAAVDDLDGALDALDAAAVGGLRAVTGIDAEAAFDRLRDHPRYAAARARIARNERPTADDPPFRSFDFWVGNWEARTADGILTGHNRIEIALDGAAIVERWTGISGYRGMSLNRYDRRTDRWRQTWVDDQGDIVEFEDGRAQAGQLAFESNDPGGHRRLTFTANGPDAFRQVSERSEDGSSWTVEYDLRYRRLGDRESSSD